MRLLKVLAGTLVGTGVLALLVRARSSKDFARLPLTEGHDSPPARGRAETSFGDLVHDGVPAAAASAVNDEVQGIAASRSRRMPVARLVRSNLSTIFAILIVVVWLFTLRPVTWGGPAGYDIVSGVSMKPTLQPGDLVLSTVQQAYSVGDIITYHVPAGSPVAGAIVVHRIVGGDSQTGFITKGDNNSIPDPWHPTAQDVIGRVWVYAPGVGRLFLSMRTPLGLALTMGLVAGLWWLFSPRPPEDKQPARRRRLRWPSWRRQAAPARQ